MEFKKIVLLITLILVMVFASSLSFAFTINYDGTAIDYTGPNVTLILNDSVFKPSEQQMPPIIIENRTLVPVREVFELLGGNVEWDSATRKVKVTIDDNNVELTIDSNVALVNGSQQLLDVSAKIINSKTMVPVRFISEKCGLDVNWDGDSHTVTIKKLPKEMKLASIFDSNEFKTKRATLEAEIIKAASAEMPEEDMKKIVELYKKADVTTDEFVKFSYFIACYSDLMGKYSMSMPILGIEGSALDNKYSRLREEAIEKEINVSYPTLYYMIAEGLTWEDIEAKGLINFALPAGENNKSRQSTELYYVTCGLTRTGIELKKENIEKTMEKLKDLEPLYEIKDLSKLNTKYSNNTKWTTDGSEQKFYVSAYGSTFMLPGYPLKLADGSTAYYINEENYYIVSKNPENVEDERAIILDKPLSYEVFTYFNGLKEMPESSIYKVKYTMDVANERKISVFSNKMFRYDVGSKAGSTRLSAYKYGYTVDNPSVLYYLISKYTTNEVINLYANKDLPKEQIPIGYKLPDKLKKIIKDSGVIDEDVELEVAYLIDDSTIDDYDGKLFYGSNANEEKHYITNTGNVIVLPGLKIVERDGTEKYYISDNCYYTLEKGEKPITLTETYGIDENSKVIH